MKESKKMRSVARRFSRKWAAGLFATFLFFDFLGISLSLGAWCYFQETKDDQSFHIVTERRFHTLSPGETLPGSSEFTKNTHGIFFSKSIGKGLSQSKYVYKDYFGAEHDVFAGKYLILLYNCLSILLMIQFFLLLLQICGGAKSARKLLTPLEEVVTHTKLQSGQQQARFVSDAAHELRTPISVIQGYANMLDRWGKKDKTVLDESITAIKTESDRMKQLVEQLLFLARGDSGKMKFVMEDISMTEMIQEVYDESIMIDPDHNYQLKTTSEDVRTTGDVSMLKQAVRILVDNAAKYTPKDARILLWAERKENGECCFVVQDEGIGMEKEDVSHIFERFFRSDPARSKDSGGVGLGLSIAKWIVDQHKGYFQVLSREEMGTKITLCLPKKKEG